MPHAVADETMGGSFNEADEISRFLGGGLGMGDADGQEQQFDQADKADDAVDYEDISDDDDLPDEEEATHQTNGEGEDGLGQDMYSQVPGSLGGAPPVQPVTNGFHDPAESSDGLFADGDEVNDLFGERLSSPEEERHPQRAPPQQRPGGLALPSKSSLALPTFSAYAQPQRRTSQSSPTSMSPPSFQDREYSAMSPASMTEEDDEDDLDPNIALQRRLFKASKMRANGEDIINEPADTDMALFNHLYSGYERSQVPRFTELFPPRYVEYKGKAPIKPPKVVVPTKLSLDLLQDQERSFKAVAAANKAGQESTFNKSFIVLGNGYTAQDESDDDLANSDYDENELVGGVSMQDLALICQDWDIVSLASGPEVAEPLEEMSDGDDWDTLEQARPTKKRKTNVLGAEVPFTFRDFDHSFEEPEHAVAKLAKSVALDLNDPHLLIDEHAPRHKKKLKRMPGDLKRDSALSRDIAKRYNISNDQAYDLLKENHQHKVRSTLGSMAVEHSLPAVKLQFPFYRVSLEPKAKRCFHRPSLEFQKGPGREYRFQKPKHIKKKNVRGKEAKEVFAKAEDLSLGDSASLLLLEYSEEAPMTLSNFGMGNRFINYYRKLDAEDQTRPKEPIGEAQVLLPQDKSPFANFGHVDKGEIVPTIQNGLYRAPVFAHKPKHTDFVVGVSTTHEKGDFLYLRNVENLHTVGQQFPLAEVPGQHSRKVTDAAKKRLRALSYRIYTKSLTRKDKVLDNATLMPHLPGHDMPQTRSKMREFMKYDRGLGRSEGVNGTWVPNPGQPVPDAETLRSWIRPEDVCLLDSMQVGVQHLSDIGIAESKDGDDGGDVEEGANIELQLAPWRATKNFLNACQGKAMLTLHGDGDPTGHGLGFSFVKTSMKGGFQAQGESASDKMDAKKRKDNGGHSYNVAKQQKQYDESIRRIWEQQKESLSNDREQSDDEMEDEPDRSAEYNQSYAHTPRSSMSTPAAFASRHDDDSVSQFSGQSASRPGKKLLITRKGGFDQYGQPLPDFTEEVTNPAVIREYKKRAFSKQLQNQSLAAIVPTGDKDKDHFARLELEKELARIQRNADRREARDRLKARNTAGSPAAAASPGRSDIDGPASTVNGGTEITPQKGKGRSKDGTARKCANCGQVGHIKTNRKSVTFLCPFCNAQENIVGGDSSHGPKKGAKRSGKVNGGEASRAVASSYSKFQL